MAITQDLIHLSECLNSYEHNRFVKDINKEDLSVHSLPQFQHNSSSKLSS